MNFTLIQRKNEIGTFLPIIICIEIDFHCINFHSIISNIASPSIRFGYYKMQCSSCPTSYKYLSHQDNMVFIPFQHISRCCRTIYSKLNYFSMYHTIQSIFSHTISVQLAIPLCNILHVHNLNNLLTELSWKMLTFYICSYVFCQIYI